MKSSLSRYLARGLCVAAVVLSAHATARGAMLLTFENPPYTAGTLGTQDNWANSFGVTPISTVVTSPALAGAQSLQISGGGRSRAFQPSEGGALSTNGMVFSYLQAITVHGGATGNAFGFLSSNIASSTNLGVGFKNGNIDIYSNGSVVATFLNAYNTSASDVYLVEIVPKFTPTQTFTVTFKNMTTNSAPITSSSFTWGGGTTLTGFIFFGNNGTTAVFDNITLPEPASLALLGLGGWVVVGRRRRRNG